MPSADAFLFLIKMRQVQGLRSSEDNEYRGTTVLLFFFFKFFFFWQSFKNEKRLLRSQVIESRQQAGSGLWVGGC